MLRSWTKQAVPVLAVAIIASVVGLFATDCFAGAADAAAKVASPLLPRIAAWFLSYFLRLTGIGALITLLVLVWDKPHEVQQAFAVPAAGCGLLQAYGWWGFPWTTVKGTQFLGVEVTPDKVQWSPGTFVGYVVMAGICGVIFLVIVEAKKNDKSAK